MNAYSTTGFEASYNGAIVNGAAVQIPVTTGLIFGGPAFLQFTAQTTVTGRLQMVYNGGHLIDLLDSSEAHGQPGTAFSSVTKLLALVQAPFTLQWLSSVTTGGAIIVVRAIPNY